MRKRRLRRKEIKRRNRIIIASLIATTFLFASGYAAFSTNVVLNAKGNIKEKANVLVGGQKVYLATSGDGLYLDTYEDGRYIYKGKNPNNYIEFDGGETWRIYSIESDGTIKIVKDESLGNMQFDPAYTASLNGVSEANSVIGTRYSSASSNYCYRGEDESSYWGCSSWGSKYTTLDSNNNHVTSQSKTAGNTSTTYDLPEGESYINVYLNHQFNNANYKGLNSSKDGYEEIVLPNYYNLNASEGDLVQTKLWNIGSPAVSFWNNGPEHAPSTNMTDLVGYEKYYKWSGKVGLLTVSEYMRANTNTTDCYTLNVLGNNYSVCNTTNYLYKNYNYWLISPTSTIIYGVEMAYSNGFVSHWQVFAGLGIRPSLYLSSTIRLKGSGSSNNPYKIIQ